MYLQPISYALTAAMDNPGFGKPVSPVFLSVLLLIAGLIQVIACINFMNLSTARVTKRAKEVGVRKVIGAGRKDLVRQFLGESLLLSLFSVVIAVPLLVFALPLFNQITQTDINANFLRDYRVWILLGSLIGVTGLTAGSYPAFYLSAFKVVKVIKENFTIEIFTEVIRRRWSFFNLYFPLF
jgi:putative ABC transport system permease protein